MCASWWIILNDNTIIKEITHSCAHTLSTDNWIWCSRLYFLPDIIALIFKINEPYKPKLIFKKQYCVSESFWNNYRWVYARNHPKMAAIKWWQSCNGIMKNHYSNDLAIPPSFSKCKHLLKNMVTNTRFYFKNKPIQINCIVFYN